MKFFTGYFRAVLGGLCVGVCLLAWPAIPFASAQGYHQPPSPWSYANGGSAFTQGQLASVTGGPGQTHGGPVQGYGGALYGDGTSGPTYGAPNQTYGGPGYSEGAPGQDYGDPGSVNGGPAYGSGPAYGGGPAAGGGPAYGSGPAYGGAPAYGGGMYPSTVGPTYSYGGGMPYAIGGYGGGGAAYSGFGLGSALGGWWGPRAAIAPSMYGYPGAYNCYRWRVFADAMFLHRATSAGDLSLAFGSALDPKGTELFNAEDLDFGIQWGPRIGIARCCTDFTNIGIEYFGIDGWQSTGQVQGAISAQFPSIVHLTVPAVGGTAVATYDYRSELFNTELNVRHRLRNVCWLTVLAGFRWVELGEEFYSTFATNGLTSAYLIDVNNHLYGFQLGAEANVKRWGPWSLDTWLKAGVYGNSADQDTLENLAALGGGAGAVRAGSESVAFVGDLGLTVTRRITCQLAARAGYQLLWIDGVALAPDQLDNSNINTQIASLDSSGSLFYHGGFVGLEYIW
jgi:hypothetical protein